MTPKIINPIRAFFHFSSIRRPIIRESNPDIKISNIATFIVLTNIFSKYLYNINDEIARDNVMKLLLIEVIDMLAVDTCIFKNKFEFINYSPDICTIESQNECPECTECTECPEMTPSNIFKVFFLDIDPFKQKIYLSGLLLYIIIIIITFTLSIMYLLQSKKK